MARFRDAVPVIATAIVLPCLVGLGMWQLDRSTQKRESRDLVNMRIDQPPVTLTANSTDADALRYRSVVATGRYDRREEILLDNQVLKGRAGYHVLTPLKLAGSDVRVLVNRGWVPWGDDRTQLPVTPAPDAVVTVTGRATVPSLEYFELKKPDDSAVSGKPWPRVWQNLDLGRFAALAPYRPLPIVIELDAASAAGGFERQWRNVDDGWVERHHGYAMQWFGLALTLVVINLILWRRRRRSRA